MYHGDVDCNNWLSFGMKSYCFQLNLDPKGPAVRTTRSGRRSVNPRARSISVESDKRKQRPSISSSREQTPARSQLAAATAAVAVTPNVSGKRRGRQPKSALAQPKAPAPTPASEPKKRGRYVCLFWDSEIIYSL